jgi:tetratricopeptide (TPR) repeat protein
VAGDPYLEYSLVAGKWQELERLAGGPDDTAPERVQTSDRTVQARGLAEEAAALEKSAALAHSRPRAARAALLRAQILASPLLRDSRAALTALADQWDALRAEPETARIAGWLRVELMMDVGLLDAASKALAELPDGGKSESPQALLRLAEALAGRAAGLAPQAQAEVQREVLRFTDRAMSMAVSDPATFRTVRRRAARAMSAAGALADAQRVLTDLLAAEEARKDPRAFLDDSLLLAQVLERAGKPEESMKRLDGLAERYADSAALHLSRSRCLAAVGRHEESAGAARQARALSAPGSEDWCRATIALAEGLAAQGHTAAAADILRVAGALHPNFANTELRGRLKALRENLKTR